jgi:MOSC domain-containing protein YiiM
MKIIGLYTGDSSIIGPKNSPTGIFKHRVNLVQIDSLGIIGDVQADKRFHGGPEKALHQYALSGYERIIKRYPLLHKKAQPGAIGENITATSMNDKNVCIGDIYQIGEVKVQVSSPRIPCWKIDEKFKQPNLNKFVGKNHITGWYYRVLEGGSISLHDKVELTQRPNSFLTVSLFMQIVRGTIKDNSIIKNAVLAQGLDPEWCSRLQK